MVLRQRASAACLSAHVSPGGKLVVKSVADGIIGEDPSRKLSPGWLELITESDRPYHAHKEDGGRQATSDTRCWKIW
jgi:hypothetical protein